MVHTKADGHSVERLEDKVQRLEDHLAECTKERARLERREIELMRQLVK